jgi:SAM-dependent MidA family methyltransferase
MMRMSVDETMMISAPRRRVVVAWALKWMLLLLSLVVVPPYHTRLVPLVATYPLVPTAMILRRHIGERLHAYYAQSADTVVGGLSPVHLSSLWGRWHWMLVYERLYKETQGQWLTPVELFQPHYSQAIANYIASLCDDDNPSAIDIVELGGGRGTNARHVMDHLANTRNDVFQRISAYHLVDASPTLLQLQKQSLSATVHAEKFRFQQKDLLDVAEEKDDFFLPASTEDDRMTIVMGLEVMDNLPHDKIRIRGKSGMDQAVVRMPSPSSSSSLLEEAFVPLSDALLKRVLELDACPPPFSTRTKSKSAQPLRYAWIPTVTAGILSQLYQQRPGGATHVLLADFDWLPPPNATDKTSTKTHKRRSRWAQGEPLVTNMNDVDQPCYLSAVGEELCDILFPTNFATLAKVVSAASAGAVLPRVQQQALFLLDHGPDQVKATKSWLTGFSPLLKDFGNCSVLTTSRAVE